MSIDENFVVCELIYDYSSYVLPFVRQEIERNYKNIAINLSQISLLPINRAQLTPAHPKYREAKFQIPDDATKPYRPIIPDRQNAYFTFQDPAIAKEFFTKLKSPGLDFNYEFAFGGSHKSMAFVQLVFEVKHKQRMFNQLVGSGSERYATRSQVLDSSIEIMSNIEEYKYADSELQDYVNKTVVGQLEIQDFVLTTKKVSEINKELWAQLSSYKFDKNDISPTKVTNTMEKISQASNYESANKMKIGFSSEASFLKFSGKLSGNYENQNDYKESMEFAFDGQWEGEKFIPKALKINELNKSYIKSKSVITKMKSVSWDGEGYKEIQRNSKTGWSSEFDKEIFFTKGNAKRVMQNFFLDSPHPLPSTYVMTYSIEAHKSAIGIQIHFKLVNFLNPPFKGGVFIFDQNGKRQGGYWYGNNFWTPMLPGNKMFVRWYSFDMPGNYGASIDRIGYLIEPPSW